MVDGVKVTVRRKDELFAKLKGLAPEAEKELTAANTKAAEEMAALARGYVPVRSGRLRDSIAVTPAGGTPPAFSQGARAVSPGAVMVTAGNARVRYAHLVEYGAKPHIAGGMFAGAQHPGAPAQPFFWPSYRLIRRGMRSRAARAINKSVKAVAGK